MTGRCAPKDVPPWSTPTQRKAVKAILDGDFASLLKNIVTRLFRAGVIERRGGQWIRGGDGMTTFVDAFDLTDAADLACCAHMAEQTECRPRKGTRP